MTGLEWLMALAYGTLVLEMVVFRVPSEASTFQLFFPRDADDPRAKRSALRSAQRRSVAAKLLFYLFPTALGVGLFAIPLVAAFRPELIDLLLPVESLEGPGVRGAGVVLVVLGRFLTLGSMFQLRRRQREGQLSAAGLFRWSRNPGLVGMYAFYLGAALVFPCVVLFVGFLPYVLNMHQRVLMEEHHLAAVLGPEYRVYLESVPRYLFRARQHS